MSVIASSPSHGPSTALPPKPDQLAQLRRGARHLDLEIGDVSRPRARGAPGDLERDAPLTGASWIMIGMATASDSVRKKASMPASPARIVAPW